VAATEFIPLGDSALIWRLPDSANAVRAAVEKLISAEISGVQEIVPAFASVGIFFRNPIDPERCADEILMATRKRRRRGRSSIKPRTIEIPVCYESIFAPDLEAVAKHCRLSPAQLIARHSKARYEVRCVGFTPGFPYLSGLPKELAMPRRATPRSRVPAGSVAIGGSQTGIYSLPSPGGWNLIGRTPLRLFDPKAEEPTLLRMGDRVRFQAISAEQFEQWPV
jgi:inhibitor of KinA